jgi:hypothetical protein
MAKSPASHPKNPAKNRKKNRTRVMAGEILCPKHLIAP